MSSRSPVGHTRQPRGRVDPGSEPAPWKDALRYHSATRDVATLPSHAWVDTLKARRAQERPPSSVKRIRGAEVVKLPKTALSGEFQSVLRARRTWRAFAPGSITLDHLSTLLWLTAGVMRWERPIDGGRVALKTSPSGGALHPSELYVLPLAVSGLARGLYHYRPDVNALEQIRRGARRSEVGRYIPEQPYYAKASIVVFFTSVFTRSQWRYRHSRAYRANLIEVGHLCQTFCLVATWLGLAPFCSMALADSPIEQELGIDGVTESVLYAAGAGLRPPGVDWAPAPLDPSISWPRTSRKRPSP